MNKVYKFQYRRGLFWKKVSVIGHGYISDQNKMILYHPSGAVSEIRNWSKCELFLDTDWVLAVKKDMTEKAGQTVSLAVG